MSKHFLPAFRRPFGPIFERFSEAVSVRFLSKNESKNEANLRRKAGKKHNDDVYEKFVDIEFDR